jgi:hypothetical protein
VLIAKQQQMKKMVHGSGIWPISYFLETIAEQQAFKDLQK